MGSARVRRPHRSFPDSQPVSLALILVKSQARLATPLQVSSLGWPATQDRSWLLDQKVSSARWCGAAYASMVWTLPRSGVVSGSRRLASKAMLLAGGERARAGRYPRASRDKKEQCKSVHDQGVLSVVEIGCYGWTGVESFTDNDRLASRNATRDRLDFERLMESIEVGLLNVLVWLPTSDNNKSVVSPGSAEAQKVMNPRSMPCGELS